MPGPWDNYQPTPAPAEQGPWAKYGAAPPASTPQPSAMEVLTQPTDKTDKEYLGYKGPAGVVGATLHGLNKVAGATGDAVKGAIRGLDPRPQGDETWEGNISDTLRNPVSVIGKRMMRGVGETGKQAMQVPAAVRDVNASSDPLGTYAKAAEDTADQGAGQALTALGTEGAIRGVPKVVEAAPKAGSAMIRGGAKTANLVLEKAPSAIGATAGAALGSASHIPGAAEVGGIAGYSAGKMLPKMRIPGEDFGLPKPVYPGATLPEAPPPEVSQARPIGKGAVTPPEPAAGLGKLPAPKPEEALPEMAKPNTSSKAIQGQINDSLGGRPLQPGVKLRDQGKIQPPATPALSDMKPVDSTAVKAYKYDPTKQEFTATNPDGQTFIHGDVSQDEAKAFEKASSKGKAWKVIKDNHPLVAKIVNGQRISHIPSIRSASPDDVTPEK